MVNSTEYGNDGAAQTPILDFAAAPSGLRLLHHFVERLGDARFGHRVERAGRFIEDQDRRVFEQCARDGEALTLAAGTNDMTASSRGASPL